LYELFARLKHSPKQPAFLVFSAEILSFMEPGAAEGTPTIEIKALMPTMFQTKRGHEGDSQDCPHRISRQRLPVDIGTG
jgi:hypothetical protein